MVRYLSAEGCDSSIGSGRSRHIKARLSPCAARMSLWFECILKRLDTGQCRSADLGFRRQWVGLRFAQECHDKRPAAGVDHADVVNDSRERACLVRDKNSLIEQAGNALVPDIVVHG